MIFNLNHSYNVRVVGTSCIIQRCNDDVLHTSFPQGSTWWHVAHYPGHRVVHHSYYDPIHKVRQTLSRPTCVPDHMTTVRKKINRYQSKQSWQWLTLHTTASSSNISENLRRGFVLQLAHHRFNLYSYEVLRLHSHGSVKEKWRLNESTYIYHDTSINHLTLVIVWFLGIPWTAPGVLLALGRPRRTPKPQVYTSCKRKRVSTDILL